ncbi:MAG: glycosyltransferase family 4 protein [Bacteroidetes bacterium]|nr:glycosyltransferase family 4 protein [Bacteroidota bacterium]
MAEKIKLAIISTHPIQYNAPLFKLLSGSDLILPRVFYTWSQSMEKVEDKDFGKTIQWDIPLLDGYEYEFVENISNRPGTGHFSGMVNPGLIAAIRDWGAQALLVYGWNFKSHLKAMRYFKGRIPVFFRGDSTLLDETGGYKQKLRRIFLKWVYRHTDYAFYVGTNNKRYFEKHGIPPARLFFAPHSIDNNRFYDHNGDYREKAKVMRKEAGIPEDAILVAFTGKFQPKKDPLLLINAALHPDCRHLHFLFVGNGILEEQMRAASTGAGNIHFMGFRNQSEMPAVYYMADVICLPSRGPGETWGLVINEAMSCERAVVASSKTGCAIDLIENGKNGYIFEAGNAEELTAKLSGLRTHEITANMGAESRRIISSWSYEKTMEGFEKGILTAFGKI